MRFVHNVKAALHKKPSVVENEASVNEIESAKRLLIRDTQRSEFKEEVKFLLSKSNECKKVPVKFHQFNHFIDENGILQCRYRLGNAADSDAGKYPILLPAHNLYSHLVVMEAHRTVFHNGIRETLNCLHQKYWILRGIELVQAIIRSVLFVKLEGLPFKFNLTPSLPLERVENCVPFKYIAIVFARPLVTKDLFGQNTLKTYICLFTCASTRAVHLEIVESLGTETSIRAFRNVRLVGDYQQH